MKCAHCGATLPKKRIANGRRLKIVVKYCSDICRLRANNAVSYARRKAKGK